MIGCLFYSCDDDKNEKTTYPLTFEKDSYEARIGMNELITIRSGNQHYTIDVDDDDILDASALSPTSGQILINGKRKGKTSIEVTDNITGDKVKLNITITDTYIAYKLSDSKHPLFVDAYCFFLIKNENKDFYIYSINQTQDELSLMTQGNYTFSVEDDIPYLSFNYQDLTNGDMSYKFNILETPGVTKVLLNRFYELNWDSLTKSSKTSSPPVYILKMKDEKNDINVESILFSHMMMPEGVLK